MYTTSSTTALRVRPRVWLGLGLFVAYLAVFYAIWIVNGIDYARVGESEETLLRWYVAPLGGGLVVILVGLSVLGWWRPSLRDTKRLPRSGVVVPVIMAVVAVLNLVFGEFSRVTMTMWILLVIGSILVGFNEEVVARGQLFVALRSRFGELGVWFLSTALFSLLHLPNFFFGIGSLAFLQVVIQFGLGSVYYLAFRSTGSLVPAMLLHGLWDFSTFSSSLPYAGLAAPFLGIAGVVVAVVLLVKERRRDADARSQPIR
ncbi:CPBP family intramembrane metalloprotease [Isoptericola sp. S6320L]|uniref:CPBP family intramembrane glutamic endopeptidase n=1 Tax=Isoptericola sp. S6320L TaxID=2926411 RepID=UPI001FF24AF0|nr:type II CAAX endopeptidase family protein [Isoptericola sp. S6320L]MCK0116476.1 CPBP family intramembrane metalloprotease [Isoptericola sp. S6320L]